MEVDGRSDPPLEEGLLPLQVRDLSLEFGEHQVRAFQVLFCLDLGLLEDEVGLETGVLLLELLDPVGQRGEPLIELLDLALGQARAGAQLWKNSWLRQVNRPSREST